jgi:hypothetical protein
MSHNDYVKEGIKISTITNTIDTMKVLIETLKFYPTSVGITDEGCCINYDCHVGVARLFHSTELEDSSLQIDITFSDTFKGEYKCNIHLFLKKEILDDCKIKVFNLSTNTPLEFIEVCKLVNTIFKQANNSNDFLKAFEDIDVLISKHQFFLNSYIPERVSIG